MLPLADGFPHPLFMLFAANWRSRVSHCLHLMTSIALCSFAKLEWAQEDKHAALAAWLRRMHVMVAMATVQALWWILRQLEGVKEGDNLPGEPTVRFKLRPDGSIGLTRPMLGTTKTRSPACANMDP